MSEFDMLPTRPGEIWEYEYLEPIGMSQQQPAVKRLYKQKQFSIPTHLSGSDCQPTIV